MCVPTSAEAVTFYVILHLKGDLCINAVIITGFSCSLVELKLPTHIPRRQSTLSLDRTLNAMCHLDVLMPPYWNERKANNQNTEDSAEIGIERQRRRHGEVEMDKHTRECTSEDRKCNPSLPCAPPLSTRERAPYPHSVRVTLMELIWETSAALPGRGIYWQGESQTQSITLPVCPIISHQERWPAKINWLFHKNNPSGKMMCCLQSEATFLHSGMG